MRTRSPTRARLALLLVAIASIAAVVLLSREGDSGSESRAADRQPIDALIDSMRARYPEIQRPNGHFRSSIGGGTRYGNAYMGYALLMSGVRAGDDAAIEAGLRGLTNPLQPGRRPNRPSVFESLALAAGYNIAKEHAEDEPLFRENRPAWEDFLQAGTADPDPRGDPLRQPLAGRGGRDSGAPGNGAEVERADRGARRPARRGRPAEPSSS